MTNLKLSYLVVALLMLVTANCQNSNSDSYYSEIENAKAFVRKAINDKNDKPFYDTLITSSETAIRVVEPILFNIYGKANIEYQKPYKTYLINGYWYISGTLPKDMKGGVFGIVINSKDGRVIKLVHGK